MVTAVLQFIEQVGGILKHNYHPLALIIPSSFKEHLSASQPIYQFIGYYPVNSEPYSQQMDAYELVFIG